MDELHIWKRLPPRDALGRFVKRPVMSFTTAGDMREPMLVLQTGMKISRRQMLAEIERQMAEERRH